ncbi:MAG: hypothetical protein WC568_08525 [Candidatus Methanoperedens sp.]
MSKIWFLCLILIIAAMSGCTDKKTEPVNTTLNHTQVSPTPAFTVPEPSTVYVEIKGSLFDPLELRVIRGTTVRWTNMDSAQHTVNGDDFRSPVLNKRDVWSYTFNKTGTFEYSCSVHPSMPHARIIIT